MSSKFAWLAAGAFDRVLPAVLLTVYVAIKLLGTRGVDVYHRKEQRQHRTDAGSVQPRLVLLA
jgi:hypothetical protein